MQGSVGGECGKSGAGRGGKAKVCRGMGPAWQGDHSFHEADEAMFVFVGSLGTGSRLEIGTWGAWIDP